MIINHLIKKVAKLINKELTQTIDITYQDIHNNLKKLKKSVFKGILQVVFFLISVAFILTAIILLINMTLPPFASFLIVGAICLFIAFQAKD